MDVRFGTQTLRYPSEQLGDLRESNDLYAQRDWDALRQRIADDGYLFIRELIGREKVQAARACILEYMNEQDVLSPGRPVFEGAMPKSGKGMLLMGKNTVAEDPAVKAALEADELFDFFNQFFRKPSLTFDYKWLRAVGHERYTGAHYDVIYMGRGSPSLHTAWLPLGDLPLEHGTLAILTGSHNLPSFQRLRDTYGKADVDRDLIEGWFGDDPLEITGKFGGQWKTAEFRMGDALIFGMYTMHGATTNMTDRFRISCDVRFQPAGDPVDERWGGANPTGHYAWGREGAVLRPMTEVRAEWGV